MFSTREVLRKLVVDASKFLNDKVAKAVITVPAYFNDSRRTATKDAGRITNISLPFIAASVDGPKHIETTLPRAKFEELCSALLDRCLICSQAMIEKIARKDYIDI